MSDFECKHNHCGRCCGGSCPGSCAGCSSVISLTEDEVRLLDEFKQFSFLPVASKSEGKPVYIKEDPDDKSDHSEIIIALRNKRLISIDYDLPLSNYDYANYAGCSNFGSMALTELGQDVVNQIDVSGIDQIRYD